MALLLMQSANILKKVHEKSSVRLRLVSIARMDWTMIELNLLDYRVRTMWFYG